MLAVTRCQVPTGHHAVFHAAAQDALTALAARPGFRRGHVGRAMDDETQWVLSSEWEGVGAYRRGLASYDVRIALAPLMAYVLSEPGAYDVVARVDAEPGTALAAVFAVSRPKPQGGEARADG